MPAIRSLISSLFSLLQQFSKWWTGRFQSSSARGKAVMGCSSLLTACFACSLCSVAANTLTQATGIAPTSTTVSAGSRSQIADIEAAPTETSTQRRTATAQPTNTAVSTAAPTTPTTAPTNTPQPTNTAVPSPTANPQFPTSQTATVTNIIDGDTIDVSIDGTTYPVRYIGMDTPERGAPFFDEATQANAALVASQTVILVKDVSETDQYGRLLRYVYLQDGTFVNTELVRQGMAQIATYPPDVAYQETFLQLQQEARAAGIGLWAAAVAAAPTGTPIPQPTNTAAPPPPNPPPTDSPPPDPQPTDPPPPAPGNVQITSIFYDGAVSRVESDEYAVITNNGGSPVNLGGWRLNAGDQGQDFSFPGIDLQPGQSCRVYTNQVHPDSCGGGTFGSGRAIWNNDGDCGMLYDSTGAEVSRYCY